MAEELLPEPEVEPEVCTEQRVASLCVCLFLAAQNESLCDWVLCVPG